MFNNMKQFLSSEVCLSCEGCCRFDKEKSDWRPKVGESEERSIIINLPLDKKIESRSIIEKGGYLKDKLCHGMFTCTFFNSDDSTCGIYHNRPFECKLYPFVLTKVDHRVSVSVHLPCPYVQQKKGSVAYDKYTMYLKELFQKPDVKLFLKENSHLFGDYLGYELELEWVFDVSL
jgi:Fe-S-cluster containining protein